MENISFSAEMSGELTAVEKSLMKLKNPFLTEFRIQDDILTVRTTSGELTAPIKDVTVKYAVQSRRAVYFFQKNNGEKVMFNSRHTRISDADMDKIESIISTLPGYKGRDKADKAIYIIYVVLFVIALIIAFAFS